MAGVTFNITASTVAWYGAIVATLGGLKALNDLLNDRGRLKVNFQTDMMVAGGGKVSEPQIAITVTNKSKRPAKITHVGMRSLPNWHRALLFVGERPRLLTEEEPTTLYIQPQADLDLNNLWFVYVIDARGREYHWYKRKSGYWKWRQYRLAVMIKRLQRTSKSQ